MKGNPYTGMSEGELLNTLKDMRQERRSLIDQHKALGTIQFKSASCRVRMAEISFAITCLKDDIDEAQAEMDRRHGVMPQTQWQRRK